MPPNTVYVGRPSKWGNPFKVEKRNVIGGTVYSIKQRFSELYDNWYIEKDAIKESLRRYQAYIERKTAIELNIKELKGKNLACWCPINKPCHADILLKLANK